MNLERILAELNFLIRMTHDLQLKLQEDGKTSEEMESIISDVLLTGCRTLHAYRMDGGPVYNANKSPYLQTLFLNVCETYDKI